MIEIVPAILAKTKEELEQVVKKLEPYVERAHLDILDGGFTLGKSIHGFEELRQIETKLKFDVHFMVMHPEEYIPQWLGLSCVDRFIIHIESCDHMSDMLLEIRAQGKKAGIALNPETSVGSIVEYVSMVDFVQFMTVHPGSYGRPFLTDAIDRISTFHDKYPDVKIMVDGGMNPETVRMACAAGAEIIVSGSYVVNSNDPARSISELREAVLNSN